MSEQSGPFQSGKFQNIVEHVPSCMICTFQCYCLDVQGAIAFETGISFDFFFTYPVKFETGIGTPQGFAYSCGFSKQIN